MEHINSGVLRYAPYAMVALLPVFALLQYLASSRDAGAIRSAREGTRTSGLWRAPPRVCLHHDHRDAAGAAGNRTGAAALWILIYVARARRKVYAGSWLGGFTRSVLVAFVYVVLLALAMAALVAIAVALG
jgi:hypothetical protein